MAQWVKDLELLQLWHRLWLWLGFSPCPRNFHRPRVQPKKKNNNNNNIILKKYKKFQQFHHPKTELKYYTFIIIVY